MPATLLIRQELDLTGVRQAWDKPESPVPLPQAKKMMRTVIFGVGSPLMVDLEESCARSRTEIMLAVRNVEGSSYASDAVRTVEVDGLVVEDLSYPVLVVMNTPASRKRAYEHAQRVGFSKLATLVDPTSVVARSTRLGDGTYVNAGCVIGGAGVIGNLVLVNRGAGIGHHAIIEDYATIGPGAVIAGQVRIGRGAFIGAGAVVLPEMHVGANSVVAAGAVVNHAVAAHSLVAGNPARQVKSGVAGYGDEGV